jgi:hypothetical protein
VNKLESIETDGPVNLNSTRTPASRSEFTPYLHNEGGQSSPCGCNDRRRLFICTVSGCGDMCDSDDERVGDNIEGESVWNSELAPARSKPKHK